MNGWLDSPIESFKAAYASAVAKWNAALSDLDAAYTEFLTHEAEVQDDPEMSARYDDLSGKVNLLQSTIQNVSGAITSVQDFFKSIGSAVGMSGAPGLGLIPAIPWALVGLVTAGIAGVYVVVNALRGFNLDATNKGIAKTNLQLASEGKPMIPYVTGSGSGLFDGLSETAKYVAYGLAAWIAYQLIKDSNRGNA
jgi:hypothetical protein